MARKKVSTLSGDEDAAQPKTRRVSVVQNETRRFVEEEPEANDDDANDDGEDLELEPVIETRDSVQEFLDSITAERAYMMRVWALPTYSADGKASNRVENKIWVTSFEFGPDETITYSDKVKASHNWASTPGAKTTFFLQVVKRADNGMWCIAKHWAETIAAPLPGYIPPVSAAASAPVGPPPEPPVKQVETLKEQMSMFREMVGFAKELMPAPPAPVTPQTNGTGESNGERPPIGERILEAGMAAILGRQDTPVDTVVSILSGLTEKQRPWYEGLFEALESFAPYAGAGANALLQAGAGWIQMKAQATAIENAARAQAMGATNRPAPAAPAGLPAAALPQAPAPGAPVQEPTQPAPDQLNRATTAAASAQLNPFQQAWLRVIDFTVTQCAEQVKISRGKEMAGQQFKPFTLIDGENPPDVSVKPAAESIFALRERFNIEQYPEEGAQLEMIVSKLIDSGTQPFEIVQLCAMTLAGAGNGPAAEFIMSLKDQEPALSWLIQLQNETRAIIEEAEKGQE